jgi:hypothetical protein
MLAEYSLTSIAAITLMIMTVLLLSYHLAFFMSKHEFKNSENYTVIVRLTETGSEVVVLAPVRE